MTDSYFVFILFVFYVSFLAKTKQYTGLLFFMHHMLMLKIVNN